jgi:hypothetical protein
MGIPSERRYTKESRERVDKDKRSAYGKIEKNGGYCPVTGFSEHDKGPLSSVEAGNFLTREVTFNFPRKHCTMKSLMGRIDEDFVALVEI